MVVLNHCSLCSSKTLRQCLLVHLAGMDPPHAGGGKQERPEGRLVEDVTGNCFSEYSLLPEVDSGVLSAGLFTLSAIVC